MRVTRAPETGAPTRRREHDRRRARARTRLEAGARAGPAGVGGDHERDLRRTGRDRIGRRAQGVHARMRRTGGQHAGRVWGAAERGREDGVARAFGERGPGRAPEQRVDVARLDPGRVEGRGTGFPREREGVLVGWTDRDLAATTTASPRRRDVSGRQAPARRRGTDTEQSDRHQRSRPSGRRA